MAVRSHLGIWKFLAASVVMMLLGVGDLSAHGALKSSSPASGDTLQTPPPALRLTFTERVELSLARVYLVHASGDTVALSPLRSESDRFVIAADVTGLASPGSYVIHWSITGADGHPVRGTIPFLLAGDTTTVESDTTIQAITPTATAADSMQQGGVAAGGVYASNALLATIIRALLFAGILLVIGSVVVSHRILPLLGDSTAPTTPRTIRWGVIGGVLLIFVAAARLFVQHASLNVNGADIPYAAVLDTMWGRGWMLHLTGAVAATLLLLRSLRSARQGHNALLWISLLMLAVGLSMGGHAAAASTPSLAIANDALHVLAAGTWTGSLALMMLAVAPALRSHGDALLRAFRGFSSLAVRAVLVLVLTGLVSTWIHHGVVATPWSSVYGTVLLFKLGWVALLVLLGAVNKRSLRATTVPRGLRVRGWVEVAITLVVIFITAILVATPTPPTAMHGG